MRRNNILENVTFTTGGYVAWWDGSVNSAEGFSYSDYIPLVLGKQYIGCNPLVNQIAVFDSNKDFVIGYETCERMILALNRGTIPKTAAYFVISLWTGNEVGLKLYQLEPWEKVEVVVGKDDTSDFNTILEANLATWDAIEPVITVKAGTYDIIKEFEYVYGANYFINYTGYEGKPENPENPKDDFRYYTGIFLQNNAKYIFHPVSNVVCTVDDSMAETISKQFCPFNVRSGEIIGLNLTAKNTRYAIHDDFGQLYSIYNKHYFRNCTIKYEGTNEDNRDKCIGAGTGTNCDILIENCILTCDSNNSNHMVSYHNYDYMGVSNLVIRGCKIATGILITSHGPSVMKSTAHIYDNVIGGEIEEKFEDDPANWEVIAENNVITTA